MSIFSEMDTIYARAKIKQKSKKLARRASQKSVKYNNAQIKLRKHMYNSIRTKHK